nr:ATP-dependent helicase HrpB [Pseudohoeflea sp. DP4N28-3]
MSDKFADLPISSALPDMRSALAGETAAVLAAPPGAGKTTLVPLDLLEESWCTGRILLIEPRRLAARAAARRMAAMRGEEVGATVGYRMRLDTRTSDATRIEVVTEGVFTRMALDDPELAGYSCVLFDEFHERALEADFGLALALDIQSGLRADLRILVMSATLDVERIAGLVGTAQIIESQGRAFDVEIRYQDRPTGRRIEDVMAEAIRQMHRQEHGSMLAFLPGQSEILATAERLGDTLGSTTQIMPLYGGLSGADQDRAIRPASSGHRKVVLATPVAESSITIDGVRVVIDSGLVRQPALDPETGITRLVTRRASQASVAQRAGRAGRTEPGIALRLWHPGQTMALPRFNEPQIKSADLSGLVLDCAAWGVLDPRELRFLDPPPAAALAEARNLLHALGAIDTNGLITSQGRAMRALPLPPRLASMVVAADMHGDRFGAAMLAVLLTEQGLGGRMIDLDARMAQLKQERSPRAKAALSLARRIAGRNVRLPEEAVPAASHLAIAFPDRVARQRGGRGRFLMANGRGCEVAAEDRLAGSTYLVVADVTGRAARSRVLAAAELSGAALEAVIANAGVESEEYRFDAESGRVLGRRVHRLGAIVVSETPLAKPDPVRAQQALVDGLRREGLALLNFSRQAQHLRERVAFLHRNSGAGAEAEFDWPDLGDAALLETLEEWLVPFLANSTSLGEIEPQTLLAALQSILGAERVAALDRLAPTHYTAPTGSRIAIRYDGEVPRIAIRVQELFGESRHPCLAAGRVPLLLELLSPAQRPIQTTRDLPGFWDGSWSDVRAEMRGRYPKHPWPEDPRNAEATRRAKPRTR